MQTNHNLNTLSIIHDKKKYKKKIKLLHITIQIINLYSQRYFETKKNNNSISSEPIFYKILQLDQVNYLNMRKKSNFLELLKYIYLIYQCISSDTINKLSKKIITTYIKYHIDSFITKQYFYKFYYTYKKNFGYYSDTNTIFYKQKISEIAIINLYIINKINKKGIFFFIKYICL